jgi:CRP-like cAMP-binding protein
VLYALFVKENFVHVAAALCLAGYLCRDQLLLRALIVVGDTVYVFYYYFAPATPLWGGIFWSTVFVVVNVAMIGRIMADRAHFGMSQEEYALFSYLAVLSPGEFRRMMKLGSWRTADAPTVLTREGEVPDRLFFITAGDITLEKSGKTSTVAPGAFIGEIAFLLSRPASATVRIAPETRYVSWESARLHRLLLRTPSLRIALGRALNHDMAMKVARA